MKGFPEIILLLLLGAGCSPSGSYEGASARSPQEPSPLSDIPPVSARALAERGQVVSEYDPLTDHTKIAFLARVDAPPLEGIHLYAYFVYPGQTLSQVSEAYMGVVSLSPAIQLQSVRELTLVADGAERRFDRVSYGNWPSATPGSDRIELVLISQTFPAEELRQLGGSREAEYRLGTRARFNLTRQHRDLFSELVKRMGS
jgi:hypothetical protein